MKFLFGLLAATSLAFLVTPATAQVVDTLRYAITTHQTYPVVAQPNFWYIQRFRVDRPVKVLGFRARIAATQQPGIIAMAIFKDAGGSGVPEFMDREIQDTATLRAVSLSVPSAGQIYIASYTVPADRPLILNEPGQFYIGAYSAAGIGVLFDTTDNSTSMCGDGNPNQISAHELSSLVSYVSNNQRVWTVVRDENQRLLNGSLYIEALVEPLAPVQIKSFSDVTSLAFDTPPGGIAPPDGMQPAWADYDNDGDQDLLNAGGLWSNDGTARFTRNSSLNGVAGLAIFVDLDNDRLLDIATATKMFRNNGDGTFTEQSSTGLVDAPNTTTLTAADYDGDGLLDLFVGTWEKPVKAYNTAGTDSADVFGVGYKDHLYRNLGGFKFQETTDKALKGYAETPRGYNPFTQQIDIVGYPVLYSSNWVDYDLDGDMDLFWGVYRLAANYLWRNNGDGTFTNVATETGLRGIEKAAAPGSYGHVIGSDFADYDNDGDVDAAFGQLAHPRFYDISDRTAIYTNNGANIFADVNNNSTRAGLIGIPYNETHADVAWGDYDNDGLLDLYVNAVYECYNSGLYRQKPDHTFEARSYQSGIATDGVRGLAWVNVDKDGDLDLYVGGPRGGLFRNETAAEGKNWAEISFRLASGGNPYAVGARVKVFSNGAVYTRTITAGYGSQSQAPYVAHFGLGEGSVDSVYVHLPAGLTSAEGGRTLRFDGVPSNAVTLITDLESGTPIDGPTTGVADAAVVERVLAVSPNPATVRATLRLDASIFGDRIAIEVVDMSGQTVRSIPDAAMTDGAYDIDLEGIPAGVYLARISGRGRMAAVALTVVK